MSLPGPTSTASPTSHAHACGPGSSSTLNKICGPSRDGHQATVAAPHIFGARHRSEPLPELLRSPQAILRPTRAQEDKEQSQFGLHVSHAQENQDSPLQVADFLASNNSWRNSANFQESANQENFSHAAHVRQAAKSIAEAATAAMSSIQIFRLQLQRGQLQKILQKFFLNERRTFSSI